MRLALGHQNSAVTAKFSSVAIPSRSSALNQSEKLTFPCAGRTAQSVSAMKAYVSAHSVIHTLLMAHAGLMVATQSVEINGETAAIIKVAAAQG